MGSHIHNLFFIGTWIANIKIWKQNIILRKVFVLFCALFSLNNDCRSEKVAKLHAQEEKASAISGLWYDSHDSIYFSVILMIVSSSVSFDIWSFLHFSVNNIHNSGRCYLLPKWELTCHMLGFPFADPTTILYFSLFSLCIS